VTVSQTITSDEPIDQVLPALSLPPKLPFSVVVILVYLMIGIVAFWPVYPGISDHLLGQWTDYAQSVWFLSWEQHALAHGLNPLFSNAMYVPTGVNLAANTASPLLGLVSAPLALAFGPLTSANLLMVLAMPTSATAAFLVLRKWQVWGPGAALGGLLYGFSPYMVGQGLLHVELIFVPLPPFIALTLVSILQRRGSPRRLGIQLGLLVVAQYLVSAEVLTTVALLTVVAVACIAVRHPADVRNMARNALVPMGVALAVVTLLLTYPIWLMVAGPQHFSGRTWPLTNPYHNDLLSFVVPGPLQKVSLGMRSLGTHLTAASNPVEADGYLGVPLLILAGILAWRSRRSPRMQLSLVLLLGAGVLSLGPYLYVDGRLTHIPLPFLVLDHIPVVYDILPSRMCFEVGACLAAVIAFGLDDMRRSSTRSRQYGSDRRGRRASTILAGATLAVLVVTQLPEWPYTSQPAPGLPSVIRRAVPAKDPVAITYPYDTFYFMQPMLWETEDNFGFRLLGGYAYHPNNGGGPDLRPSVMRPPGLQQFLAGEQREGLYGRAPPVSPELVATTRASLSRYDVHLVIVDRSFSGSNAVMQLFDDALGPPHVSTGQFSLWSDWHGVPKQQVFAKLTTRVVHPVAGATLSGTTVLDAIATDDERVTKVAFLVTNSMQQVSMIIFARATWYGWITELDTKRLPNGSYRLQSVAQDATGRNSHSEGTPVTIRN
jgi:hypothetical protein